MMGSVRSSRVICFINPHSDPLGKIGEPDTGGQCIVERKLMCGLAMIDPEVRLISYTRHWGDKKRREMICPRVEVRRIACGGEDFIRKEDLGDHLEEFCSCVYEDMTRLDRFPDLFHSHYWDGGAAALMLREKRFVPLVHSSHSLGKIKQRELPDEAKYRYRVRIPWEERVYRESELIFALTGEEKEQVSSLYEVPGTKIVIVPNGVEVEHFRPVESKKAAKQEIGVETDCLVFTTGRVDMRKGYDLLVKTVPAVVRAVAEQGKSVTFFIPRGGDERSREEETVLSRLKQLVDKLEIGQYVRFFPRLDDHEVVTHYNAADIFVCPSLYEPFGLVVIEAMACRTAVVATNRGGPARIIDDGRDGLIIDPADTEIFARTLSRLLLDDEERNRMAAEGYRTAVERYSWKSIATLAMEQYQQVYMKST